MAKTDYKWLYKFVLACDKNPDVSIYSQYDARLFLNPNKDWDWNYECSKSDRVKELIYLVIFKHGGVKSLGKAEIKRACKRLCEAVCFYSEFITRAKYLTKRLKKK